MGGKYYEGVDGGRYCAVCIQQQQQQVKGHLLEFPEGQRQHYEGGQHQQHQQPGQPRGRPGAREETTTTTTTTVIPGHKLCQQCRRPIQSAYVECKGIPFHAECFKCVDCGQEGVQRLAGRVYCANCHPDKEACYVCGGQ
eukprot:CAMPEP_0114623912 /NCGR_PEP_ID=MMETSP0168-20121206/10496_1 /TAXON_ID=95228 ORGANISM="Vannella sp., Strain DIVA3 517/6/12" /NCGR_SAMPLE_ID=MMETSP0168 /ASSEMBLY_ACC=CAM_ASM_000044 /LENGTH=139 /DNA_ID=CAMNT_0001835171 /DNA_START=193 /DNA_END=609 /DNA_ORIENTATION=+